MGKWTTILSATVLGSLVVAYLAYHYELRFGQVERTGLSLQVRCGDSVIFTESVEIEEEPKQPHPGAYIALYRTRGRGVWNVLLDLG